MNFYEDKMYVSHVRSNDSVTVFFNQGLPMVLPVGNPLFAKINKSIDEILTNPSEAAKKSVAGLMDFANQIKFHTKGKFFVNHDGRVMFEDDMVALPAALSERLIDLVESDEDVDPLIKFWHRLKLNKLEDSKEQLFGWLLQHDTPLTSDGCFIGYRSCSDDYTSGHCGMWERAEKGDKGATEYADGWWKYDSNKYYMNTVGSVCEMPREEVEHDPSTGCASGLHVANYRYGSTFNSRTIEVKVDPKDVVSVPHECDGEKMRVCRFTVISEIGTEFTQNIVEVDDEYDDYDEVIVTEGEVDAVAVDGIAVVEAETVTVETVTVTPDSRGLVCIPKKMVAQAGYKPGDSALLKPKQNLVYLIHESNTDMKDEGDRFLTVDRSGNIRVSQSVIGDAGLKGKSSYVLNMTVDGEVEITA